MCGSPAAQQSLRYGSSDLHLLRTLSDISLLFIYWDYLKHALPLLLFELPPFGHCLRVGCLPGAESFQLPGQPRSPIYLGIPNLDHGKPCDDQFLRMQQPPPST